MADTAAELKRRRKEEEENTGKGEGERRKKRSRWEKSEEVKGGVDGGGPAATKVGGLSTMERLAKAKAALQKQKEIQAKLALLKQKKAAGDSAKTDEGKDGHTAGEKGGGDGEGNEEEEEEEDPYFDSRMQQAKSQTRKPRGSFAFYEPGALQKEAIDARLKSAIANKASLHAAALTIGDLASADLDAVPVEALLGGPLGFPGGKVVVAVESWDKLLLRGGGYDGLDDEGGGLLEEKISVYVEHPVPVAPPAEAPPPAPQPLMLTKKERKKLKTQRRMAVEKEKQDMIRQGLLEPPKPKVKLSNMMRVLGEEATADPTAIEAAVRTETLQRQQAHDDRNLANKLTPAERRAKKDAKLHSDTSLEVQVCVYRLRRLRSKKQRFRVDVNARENKLTGRIVKAPHCVVVVVEGGAKGIKRFRKLMLNRTKWEEEDDGDDFGDEETAEAAEEMPNACQLVWTGVVKKAAFSDFKLERCSTDYWASTCLEGAGVGHYWAMAKDELAT